MGSYMNWANDPRFGLTPQTTCQNESCLAEFHTPIYYEAKCLDGHYDHVVCLDEIPAKTDDCLIYDFGIREQPHFGAVMATVFNCEVHAFDPSPISVKWWESLPSDPKHEFYGLASNPNYHFHPYGVGGDDGEVELFEYNWGQVSNLRFPRKIYDCSNKSNIHCATTIVNRTNFSLPVKTLPTIMAELKHEHRQIDVMKIDVEGSEFGFLEHMLDTMGCPDFANQITLEWHHFSIDSRYGEGSSPQINSIVTMLNACKMKLFWRRNDNRSNFGNGWFSNDRIFYDLRMHDVRYHLASFKREK